MKVGPHIVLPILVIGLGVGANLALKAFKPEAKKVDTKPLPPLVRAVDVELRKIRIDAHTQGTVAPRTEVELTPELAGRVTWVSRSFVVGGFFQKNEELIRLDKRDYVLAEAQAKANVARAKFVLEQQEAEAAIARQEWQQLGKGKPSKLTLREPQVLEAKANLAAAKAALKKAELDLLRCVIKAPFTGRVRTKRVEQEQFVMRGAALGRIYATDFVEIRLPLHDSELQYLDVPLRQGSNRRCAVDLRARFAGRSHTWQGWITRTEGELDPKSRMIHLVARVDDPYDLEANHEGKQPNTARPPLKIGMFVSADIHGRVFDNVVQVPRAAIRNGNQVLVIANKDGAETLHYRTVEVLRSGAETALLKSGLQAGERLCISPMTTVVEGMAVRTAKDEDSQPTAPLNGGNGHGNGGK